MGDDFADSFGGAGEELEVAFFFYGRAEDAGGFGEKGGVFLEDEEAVGEGAEVDAEFAPELRPAGVLGGVTVENRLLKKSMIGDGDERG